MKRLLSFIGGVCLLSGLLIAQAQAEPVRKQGDALAAQVGVTRDLIGQVLTKMRNSPVGTGSQFSHPDFLLKAEAFNVAAEKAMVDFETTFQNQILPQVRFWVDRLQAILDSPSYNAAQKDAILRDQFAQAEVGFDGLSRVYGEALYRLFTVGLPKIEMEFKFCDDDAIGVEIGSVELDLPYKQRRFRSPKWDESHRLLQRLNQCLATKYYSYGFGYGYCNKSWFMQRRPLFYGYFIEDYRDRIFARVVRKDCYSSSCLALSSSHFVAYLRLIDESLNRPVEFKVADMALVLAPLSMRVDQTLKYLELRVTDGAGLPFDISKEDFAAAVEAERLEKARAQQQEQRRQTVAALETHLFTPAKKGLISSWECPRAVNDLFTTLCKSEMGCITDAEVKDLTVKIEDSKLAKKGKRINCLNAR